MITITCAIQNKKNRGYLMIDFLKTFIYTIKRKTEINRKTMGSSICLPTAHQI